MGVYSENQLETEWNVPKWSNGIEEGRVEIVEDSDGNKFMRVKYPAGEIGSKLSGAQWKMNIPMAEDLKAKAMTCSYKVRFSSDFDFVLGGKLPGLCGGDANTGGDKPTGTDGFSARMMWRAYGKVVQYVYHPDQPDDWGEDFPWDLSGQVYFQPGIWHTVKTTIILNTPTINNGLIMSWFDNNLALKVEDIRFRDTSSLYLDVFYFSTFFGGNTSDWAPPLDLTADFDEFRIINPDLPEYLSLKSFDEGAFSESEATLTSNCTDDPDDPFLIGEVSGNSNTSVFDAGWRQSYPLKANICLLVTIQGKADKPDSEVGIALLSPNGSDWLQYSTETTYIGTDITTKKLFLVPKIDDDFLANDDPNSVIGLYVGSQEGRFEFYSVTVEEHALAVGPVIKGVILEVAPDAEAYLNFFDRTCLLDVVKTSSFEDVVLQLPIDTELEKSKFYSLNIDGIPNDYISFIRIEGANDTILSEWTGRLGKVFSSSVNNKAKVVKIGFNQPDSFVIDDWSIQEDFEPVIINPTAANDGNTEGWSGCFLELL